MVHGSNVFKGFLKLDLMKRSKSGEKIMDEQIEQVITDMMKRGTHKSLSTARGVNALARTLGTSFDQNALEQLIGA
jgi:hypothetical protein